MGAVFIACCDLRGMDKLKSVHFSLHLAIVGNSLLYPNVTREPRPKDALVKGCG